MPMFGIACRVDDDVDAAGRGQRAEILGHRDLAGLDRPVDRRGGASHDDVGAVVAGQKRRIDRSLGPHLGNRADPHARHQRHLDDDVGSHLPGAGKPDRDRPLPLGALDKLRRELRMRHDAVLPFLLWPQGHSISSEHFYFQMEQYFKTVSEESEPMLLFGSHRHKRPAASQV